jgi:hypothetical protein
MSCYLRHLRDIFNSAGIVVTPDNKKEIDRAIHRIVEVDYKMCPSAWRKLKQEILSDEQKKQEFVQKLVKALE